MKTVIVFADQNVFAHKFYTEPPKKDAGETEIEKTPHESTKKRKKCTRIFGLHARGEKKKVLFMKLNSKYPEKGGGKKRETMRKSNYKMGSHRFLPDSNFSNV